MKYDFLIVGAGFAGSVFARLAAEAGKSSLIIDRRNHIGGNSYSYFDETTGIEIHKYGPHIFHTNSKTVWNFINKFSSFNSYINRVKIVYNNEVYTMPINLHTINQFYKLNLNPIEAKEFIMKKKVHIKNPNNLKDYILSNIGSDLYEAFYKDYSLKQWGKDPSEIEIETAKRLPIRFNYNDNYFNDKYQGIPNDGYQKLFERMLNNKLINIELNTSFNKIKENWQDSFGKLIFTGSIDEYYDYRYGDLPYRSLIFKEIRAREILGNAVINYPEIKYKYTRIHEHKWFKPEKKHKESIGFEEYSIDTTSRNEPFYPIRNKESEKMYSMYFKMKQKNRNVIFLGRLALFCYYDMNQVIKSAMKCFKETYNT